MKVGILTQSMATNYGCNLQAFALQTTIERLGHNVEILDRWGSDPRRKKRNVKQTFYSFLKNVVKFCIGRPVYRTIRYQDRGFFWKEILRFQQTYLHLSKQLYSTDELKKYAQTRNFSCFVVGSDQVWRPAYNQNGMLENMFLDFTEGMDVKRIAYAASFGVDNWGFSEEQTKTCRRLSGIFDAISVRELSGIDLCRDYLNVKADFVLDPTMLLNVDDYNSLLGPDDYKTEGNLFYYILDPSKNIERSIKTLCEKSNLKPYTCLNGMPEGAYSVFHRKESILLSVEKWLGSFKSAEVVIVDSFHGAVFSIIYNKPFWVIGNKNRGMARFNSLLKVFDLQHRMVSCEDLMNEDLLAPIQWDRINEKIKKLQAFSIKYLKDSIGD